MANAKALNFDASKGKPEAPKTQEVVKQDGSVEQREIDGPSNNASDPRLQSKARRVTELGNGNIREDF